jgi:hypothetical protein
MLAEYSDPLKEVNMMAEQEKDRVIEGKEERQKTMDKLPVESGQAYTYDQDVKKEKGQGSGCLSEAEKAREKNQEALEEQDA